MYPGEVEEALAQHPDVADVAVIGEPHPRTGETVVAFVVPRPGDDPDPVELLRHAGRRLARYKLPTRVEVVDELPRSFTGKLLRRELSSDAADASSDDRGPARRRRDDEPDVDHRDPRRERDRERFVVTDDALDAGRRSTGRACRARSARCRPRAVPRARACAAARTAPPTTPRRRSRTTAPTPLPMPASARGSTSRWSLPTGSVSVGIVPWIGVASITPIASPVKNTSAGAHPVAEPGAPVSR